MKSAVIVDSTFAQFLRKSLQCKGYWDETRKLKRIESGKVAIPVALENETEFENLELIITEALNSRQLTEITEFKIDNVLLPPSKKSQIQTPHDKLLKALAEMLRVNKIEFTDELKKDVPGHWEVHGDLVLFPEKSFQCQIWKKLEPDIWRDIAAVFDCKKVAQKSVVSRDGFRTPQVTLLYGNNGWIHQVDNGLRFTYDVTKCMYSSGNITEKLRIAKFNCEEEIVVDLYAGIGYFTIPYLVHAQAKYVHACEWNPDAVEALKKNLQLNNVPDRCTVHYGDNRKVCPTGIADRVNLGLIPSSEPGWRVACAALNPVKGGILHIHNNVTSGQKYFNTGNSELNQSGIFNSLFNTLNKSCSSKHKSDELLVDSAVCNGNRKCLNYKEVGTCVIPGLSDSVPESYQGDTSVQVLDENAFVIESGPCDASLQQLGESASVKKSGQGRQHTEMCQSPQDTNMEDKFDDILNGKKEFLNMEENNIYKKCGKTRQEIFKSGMVQSKQDAWIEWACTVSNSISDLLYQIHKNKWTTNILHIEHVKSYAPHIDHLVLDLECHPDR